jgi:lysophospholipase L1-like esterase
VARHRAAPASPYDALTFHPVRAFTDQTVRQIIHLHRGGTEFRLHISNLFGRDTLTIGPMRVAAHTGSGGIDPSTDVAVTFNGAGSLKIPPGESVLTDPVPVRLADDSELAASMFVGAPSGPATYHPTALHTSYASTGNTTADAVMRNAEPVTSLFWITGVDALVEESAPVVAAFGDSLTDGVGTTLGANCRYPDYVARRLGRGVLNLGIGGNRLLRDGFGEAGLTRFERDVLHIPGVSHVIVQLGINDIGLAGTMRLLPAPTAEDIIDGLTSLAQRARAAGITPICATLPPCAGLASIPREETPFPGYFSEAGEQIRLGVNEWIRSTSEFEAVLDIDAALEDPDRPGFLAPDFDSGDHLHPADAGASAMAQAIDPAVLS